MARLCFVQGNYNVILVSWNTKNKNYDQAASDMRAVGRDLQFVANNLMMKNRVRRRQLWCVGHGLGAQACGISGQVVPHGRITGQSSHWPRHSLLAVYGLTQTEDHICVSPRRPS